MPPLPADSLAGLNDGSGERGSAVVEFTFFGLLLLVPVVYFVMTISQIQSGAFAVVGAADQAAKVYVLHTEETEATAAAGQAVNIALADHGHAIDRATVAVSCDRPECTSAGSTITVTVSLRIPLPFTPFQDTLRLDASTVSASATQVVGRFR